MRISETQTAAGGAAVWASLKFPILSTPIQGRPRRETVAHVERRSQRKHLAEGRSQIRTSDLSLGLHSLETDLDTSHVAPFREGAKPGIKRTRLPRGEKDPLANDILVRDDTGFHPE